MGEDHEACPRSSVGPVPCVVTANKRAQVYLLAARFEGIGGNFPLGPTLKLLPFLPSFKRVQVNKGIGRVKHKARVMIVLHVSHHTQSSLEVSFSRVNKVGRQHQDLSRNVNVANLHGPAQDADQ